MEFPSFRGVSVLIVDDERDGRELIARILEGRGARTTCVSSAGEALQDLAGEQFDILLSDIGMPEVDGYELIRRVRALGHDPFWTYSGDRDHRVCKTGGPAKITSRWLSYAPVQADRSSGNSSRALQVSCDSVDSGGSLTTQNRGDKRDWGRSVLGISGADTSRLRKSRDSV